MTSSQEMSILTTRNPHGADPAEGTHDAPRTLESPHTAPFCRRDGIFTSATPSIARYLLRQRGWMGGWLLHAGIVSKRSKLSQNLSAIW